MFVRRSPRDRLVCLAEFVGINLLAVLLLLPMTKCFLRVCLPTLIAALLKFFLPLTVSAVSGAASSNKVSTQKFCSCDYFFTQKWNNCSLNILCKCTESPFLSFPLKMNVGGFHKHESKTNDTDRYKRYFLTTRVSSR